jgi:hypothetical protein
MAVLQRPLPSASIKWAHAEMVLAVQAYNLKRAINVLGASQMIVLKGG